MNTSPVSQTAPLTERELRLAALLEDWPRRALTVEELWQLWDQVDPHSAGSVERRPRLAAALAALSDAGLVAPSRATADSGHPRLPRFLTLRAAEPSPSAAVLARAVAWRPELAWVPTARLTITQVEHLRRINVWLRDHSHEGDEIPLRERSLQILGHEKALDRLLRTGLFGPGRLELSLLRTFRTSPPLPAFRVGDGPVLLVVENDNTFHSLRSVLTKTPGRVGHVAWGAGGAFESSVQSVGQLHSATSIRYFGDLDADGVRIPANAHVVAQSLGLPSVRPAEELYRRLLETGIRQAGQPRMDSGSAEDIAEWLGPALAGHATDLLMRGERIPQEALTLNALRIDSSWIESL